MSVADRDRPTTVNGQSNGHLNPRGMTVPRHFSGADQDPYEQVQWERRTAQIKDKDGQTVFEQHDCEVPADWSQLATQVVASKYFYGTQGTSERETSVRQLVDRVARTLTRWGYQDGYFASSADAECFHDELVTLCLGQYGSFNSPVWFNVGLYHKYGIAGSTNNWRWDEDTQSAVPVTEAYVYPQASACFIQSVEDNMSSIMDLARSEAMLFKYGSGSGTELSTLRSSREKLSGGGKPSGPLGFMRVYDATASIVLSGGKCLAPHQPVFTATGVKSAQELATAGTDFIVLSYSKRLGRVAAKIARAWESGRKPVVAIHTDKGEFHVSADHPMMLRTGQPVRAAELRPGMSLMPVTTDSQDGYIRVGLQDGAKGKEMLHRMVARDVMGLEITGKVIHHDDENKPNCGWGNLVLTDHSEHGRIHGNRIAQRGEHVFQARKFPQFGPYNPMHRSSEFWQDSERVSHYLSTQSRILRESGRATTMHKQMVRAKMLRTGYELINAGYDIATFTNYVAARKATGRRCVTAKQSCRFERIFGSYEQYYQELRTGNHEVLEVRPIGIMPVYSIEVDDPEPDDKRRWSEHNYTLAPLGTTEPFMSGVVCLNTRRAAKMQTMKDWHPDVLDFIECKSIEERKAQALMAAGYSGGMDGDAYRTVLYQNSNLSVRASDRFLHAAREGKDWTTHAVTTGLPVETYKADYILERIAAGTWFCGDPGLQYHDTIQRWHTCPNTAPIESSNPCSEYLFINDSACNLASLNLLKFRRPDGSFDAAGFRAAVRIFITAQEILVDHASYPTAKIAANSHRFRPLGLGYANLGALLMSLGLSYNSDQGRALAAVITALMHGQAYLSSAEHAANLRPFEGYAVNREPMLRVMAKHRDALRAIDPHDLPEQPQLLGAAQELWDRVLEVGKQHGYRNSQVTVLAPTGTIAFMMDCDTTGVEPDIALVKYKKLAGGGQLRIVNQTVPQALRRLGYAPEAIDQITRYIDVQDTIEGCPQLAPEHLAIFDCAFSSRPGGRTIDWTGHVKMMAAVQPFLSGAISKTVNMPESTTVQDIKEAYLLGWQLGLKALAIYRDGSKQSQPLGTSQEANKQPEGRLAGTREKLPDTRNSITHKFSIISNSGKHTGYLNVGLFQDERPGEIFITTSKEGSTIRALLDAIGAAVSIGLQYGAPLEAFVHKFTHTRFEPAGLTTNREIPVAKSVLDYIFTWLGKRFVPGYEEQPASLSDDEPEPQPQLQPATNKNALTGPECARCGELMVPAGRCYRCLGCGHTNGSCG